MANRVASRRVFQPSPLDRPARSSFSLCILTLAPNLHFEFYRRSVTDEMQSPWNLRIDVASKRLMTIAKKIKNTVLLVIGFRFHSNATEGVGHDTIVAGVLNEVRQSGAHTPIYSVTDCDEPIIMEALVDRKERAKSNVRSCYANIPWRSKCAQVCAK